MTIDERIQALTMNLELMSKEIESLTPKLATVTALVEKLARVALVHEIRITQLENDHPKS